MGSKINCILVDDDPEVVKYLADFINETPFLNLVSSYNNPIDALASLEQGGVQLILLDINLPGIDGMTFAKTIYGHSGTAGPKIIFISGSGDYALEGYKVDALDYLLKPFTYEHFIKAAYKAKTHFDSQEKTNIEADHIFLKVEHELVRVLCDEIMYVESMKDYVKVFLSNGGVITALSTLKNIEETLPPSRFMRIHRSFIISVDKITSIQHLTVKIGKVTIPVSDPYKPQFKHHFQNWL